ncbi:hypothetical protein B0H19DRAFT_1070116 [Mycena capillaripes]|nr:hypothetical protein B0H19DRAFT_1070116 [Mycena capillaripes]
MEKFLIPAVRTAAYKAISVYPSEATLDAIPVAQNEVMEWNICCLCRWNQILGVDDRNSWNELQSKFCSMVITVSLLLIQSAGKTLTVLEDAMDCAGAADEAPDAKGNEQDPAIGV